MEDTKWWQTDERIKRVLINPRLEGLPFAQSCSCFVFCFVVGFNLAFSFYLSATRMQEISITVSALQVNTLDPDEYVDCNNLDYLDSFGYTFGSDLYGSGTKVWVRAIVEDLYSFVLTDFMIPEESFDVIRNSCLADYDINNNESFCLTPTKIPGIVQIQSEDFDPLTALELKRTPGDIFVRLSFEGQPYVYEIYVTPFEDGLVVLSLGVFLITDTEYYEYYYYETRSDLVEISLTVVVFPVLTHLENPEAELNRLVLAALEGVAGKNIDSEVFTKALSKSFLTCKTEESLSFFAYFGLLFDFAFFLEGAFTVLVALFFLLTVQFADKAKNYVKSSREQDFPIKKTSAITETSSVTDSSSDDGYETCNSYQSSQSSKFTDNKKSGSSTT